MRRLADLDKINLYYFDEAGFSTMPCVPYAWQPKGHTRELPSFPSKRLNVLGFMSTQGSSYFYPIEQSVNSQQVIAAFDQFTAQYEVCYREHHKPCIVVLDNAPTHTSQAFQEQINQWAARGVILHFLPPYCPEFNLIEILWRKIKYEWLPFSSYSSFTTLKVAILEILNEFKSKYQINFV